MIQNASSISLDSINDKINKAHTKCSGAIQKLNSQINNHFFFGPWIIAISSIALFTIRQLSFLSKGFRIFTAVLSTLTLSFGVAVIIAGILLKKKKALFQKNAPICKELNDIRRFMNWTKNYFEVKNNSYIFINNEYIFPQFLFNIKQTIDLMTNIRINMESYQAVPHAFSNHRDFIFDDLNALIGSVNTISDLKDKDGLKGEKVSMVAELIEKQVTNLIKTIDQEHLRNYMYSQTFWV